MANATDTQFYAPLTRVSAARRSGSSVELKVDDALMRIDVLGDALMRLKVTQSGVYDEFPTFAVAEVPETAPTFRLAESRESVEVSTSAMRLCVRIAPFRVDAYRADGSVIFEAAGDAGYAFLNDSFAISRTLRAEDAILGLGEKTGRMNRNGRSFTLWNNDVLEPRSTEEIAAQYPAGDPRGDNASTQYDPYYVSIPFFAHMSEDGGAASGFFFDNAYRSRFNFEDPAQYTVRFDGGQYTEYVFAGPSLRSIIGAYTGLTGRMRVPPLWALGYHQCRWKVYTQEMVQGLADRLREDRIPCDGLWLDIDYMNGYRVFTWNRELFPDPAAMIEALRELGLRVVTIIDPGVKAERGYEVYESGSAAGIFCKTEAGNDYIGQVWPGRTVFPDFARPEARRWWGDLNARHVGSGAAGVWNDMNEPATGDVAPGGMLFDNGRAAHDRFHNQYALLMAMGTSEGLLSAMPDSRTFILSRAGSPGIQRFAANWLGDNMSRWDHLRMSVPMSLGMGLSGQPFVGADIGGFFGDTTPELFARWMQCAALTPFCRNHNHVGQRDQYIWSFGDTYRDICRTALELRYRLMPMLYSAFIEASETGLPVQRPMAIDYQSDSSARDVDDQFLVGGSLLVAPILRPGASSRQVYLPAGTWHDWHTGAVLSGPSFVPADAPMWRIPLYAKGGTVVPMWPEAPPSTMDYHPESIHLHLFVPAADGEFESFLQEDDGVSLGYDRGEFVRTTFSVRRVGAAVMLEATRSGKGYARFARTTFRVVVHTGPSETAAVIGPGLELVENALDLSNSGEPFRLDFEVSAA